MVAFSFRSASLLVVTFLTRMAGQPKRAAESHDALRHLCDGRGSLPRALQVDRGDLPVGRGRIWKVELYDCAHLATPKRDFKLSRPVLSNGDNMPFTPAGPRNCTRQLTTEPLPLGVTSSVPV